MLAISLLVVATLEPELGFTPIYTQEITTVTEFDAQYLPMITKALSHPKMRGRKLNCYKVSVRRWPDEWRVFFAGYRQPRPADTANDIHLGNMPQNPNCPDIGFMFDEKGEISRVYGSRD